MNTLTFPVKLQGEEEEQVVVGAGAINMKNIRLFFSVIILFQTRSLAPKIIKFSTLLLKPVPNFVKSIHAWIPAASGVIATHALSGATTEVKSPQGTNITIKTGEDLTYNFYTGRWTAQSFSVTGVPDGLNFSDGSDNGSITGSIAQPGQYEIQIVGYRYANLRGSKTPVHTLNLTVNKDTESSEIENPLLDKFSDLKILTDRWQNSWLGTIYFPKDGNWIFHSQIGWLYAQSSTADTFWFYDHDLGWIYTSKNLYPFLYRHSPNGWLYHLDNSTTHRFWDYSQENKLE